MTIFCHFNRLLPIFFFLLHCRCVVQGIIVDRLVGRVAFLLLLLLLVLSGAFDGSYQEMQRVNMWIQPYL
jgi:hypothetical protein